jgi:hypothetical protein
MQGRTLLKWRSSPSGDLSDCAKELFAAAIGHCKLVRATRTRPQILGVAQSGHSAPASLKASFTEGHDLPSKWKAAKQMIGRRLSQEEAKRLLAKFE